MMTFHHSRLHIVSYYTESLLSTVANLYLYYIYVTPCAEEAVTEDDDDTELGDE